MAASAAGSLLGGGRFGLSRGDSRAPYLNAGPPAKRGGRLPERFESDGR